MYVCRAGMYVCQAGMYVCQACMYVCQAGMYVCMPVYVCLGKIMPKRTRFDSLRKTFSICSWIHSFGDSWRWVLQMMRISKTPVPVRLIQNPSACGAFSKPLCLWGFFRTSLPVRLFQNSSACHAFSKILCLSGFLYRHTYIPALHSETLHREKGFEKSSTGRGLLKHTYQHKHSNIHTNLALRNPPQGGGFWKTLDWETTFETYIPTSQSAALCKYAFQNPSPCGSFLQS